MMGLETEFGFSALDRHGGRCDRPALRELLADVRRANDSMPGAGEALFLANGGLLYIDSGDHLEWSTPECTSPLELVRYQRAGELLVARAAARLARSGDYTALEVFRSNVCYASSGVSYGAHESYLYRNFRSELPRQLLPFLASRPIVSGGGGLDSSFSGIRFSLSPRVAHLSTDVSEGTMQGRGIFNTKQEPLGGHGYRRLHLICGDANCSQFQTCLRVGTTALVLALVDAGLKPGEDVHLDDPLAAMRRFAADPACRTAHANRGHGRGITALAIQRHYLASAEQYLGTAVLPPWAARVCRAWRQTLDALAADPLSLSDRLDWPLKYRLMKQRIARSRLGDGAALRPWNEFFRDVDMAVAPDRRHELIPVPATLIVAERGRRTRLGRAIRAAEKRLAKHGLGLGGLHAVERLRWELCELDRAFGDLSERGLFHALDREGVLGHRLVEEAVCETAIAEPPAAGRARLRGREIRRLAGRPAASKSCSWSQMTCGGRELRMHDPFSSQGCWRRPTRPARPRPDDDHLDLPAFLRHRSR